MLEFQHGMEIAPALVRVEEVGLWEKPFPMYTKIPNSAIQFSTRNSCWNSYKTAQSLNNFFPRNNLNLTYS
ncbi:hypothetical protein EHQ52_17895 [Leptospira koniambonensis]|uniref:Uncharacterized protein n=1 Tax=Leptospira koniambonensis TaxID=2484950 RepID=A0A4R9J2S3_9LEPT|nr:hypothetical protein EHQ52_17895 [Leptospira koniambonensis]